MNKEVIAERKRKAECIAELYESRRNRQEDIAALLNIPVSVVRMVTQEYDFERTKKKTHDNLYEGQLLKMVICYERMDYLDAYDF